MLLGYDFQKEFRPSTSKIINKFIMEVRDKTLEFLAKILLRIKVKNVFYGLSEEK